MVGDGRVYFGFTSTDLAREWSGCMRPVVLRSCHEGECLLAMGKERS